MKRDDIDLVDLDRFTSGFPHAWFTFLRREAPVWWHPASPRAPGGSILEDLPYGVGPGVLLNTMDPPRHDRFRKLVNPGFAPRTIRALECDLAGRVGTILDAVPDGEVFDFPMDVAKELPLQAIAGLLGVPQEAWAPRWPGPRCGSPDLAERQSLGPTQIGQERAELAGSRHELGSPAPGPLSARFHRSPRSPRLLAGSSESSECLALLANAVP